MLGPEIEQQYQDAILSYEAGEISLCRQKLEKLLQHSPLHAEAQNDLGAIYFIEGFPEKALGPVSIALSIDPKNSAYRENYDEIVVTLRKRLPSEVRPKIRVAMFYDEEGWAWWIRSHAIKDSLPSDVEVDILHLHTVIDPDNYDFLLIFDHNIIKEVRGTTAISADKIILANSCPLYIHEADDSLKSNNFPAAIVNNMSAYEVVKADPRWNCCENGVDTALFSPPIIKPAAFVAGWVGHSKSIGQKGLEIIQEACRLADVPLLIVDANDKPKNSRANSQAWLRDNLYHKVSVYLCASQYEGTPNPALEALACGLPVVTTRVGNMPELIRDGANGYIVERNAEAMAEALRKVRVREMTKAARESVAPGWDWKVKAQNYADIFRRLYAQNSPAFGSRNCKVS